VRSKCAGLSGGKAGGKAGGGGAIYLVLLLMMWPLLTTVQLALGELARGGNVAIASQAHVNHSQTSSTTSFPVGAQHGDTGCSGGRRTQCLFRGELTKLFIHEAMRNRHRPGILQLDDAWPLIPHRPESWDAPLPEAVGLSCPLLVHFTPADKHPRMGAS